MTTNMSTARDEALVQQIARAMRVADDLGYDAEPMDAFYGSLCDQYGNEAVRIAWGQACYRYDRGYVTAVPKSFPW